MKAAASPALNMGTNTVVATDRNFADLIAGDKPVLVDFWAQWCTPCLKLAPYLEDIAAQYPDRITVAKLNVDEYPETARRYDVQGIPTLIVFRQGRPTHTIVGLRSKPDLVKELAGYLD